jgi:hypothetical protein
MDMLKKTLLVCGITVSCLAAGLLAQESATLVLRSGDRISGELIDHGGAGFTIKVNGQDRQIPTNDVAVVEFAGGGAPSAEAQAKLRGGQHVVALRNGQTVEGRFHDISGTRPLRVVVDTPSGQRDFNSNEIAQVWLAAPSEAVATSGTTAPAATSQAALAAGAVRVPANQQWTDTGVRVERGDRVSFTAEGHIAFSPANGHSAGPDGNPGVQTPGVPVAGMSVGGLIGRVGNSAPFPIGSNTQPIAMPADGRLMIGINDTDVSDNNGAFTVAVRRQRR